MHVNSVYKFTSFVTFNTAFQYKDQAVSTKYGRVCREEYKGNTSVQCVEKTQSFGMLKQAKGL